MFYYFIFVLFSKANSALTSFNMCFRAVLDRFLYK